MEQSLPLQRSQKACNWHLSWASWIHFTPSQPISLGSILILSSHQRLGLPSCLFPSGFPTEILHELLISPMHATCQIYPIIIYLITLITFGEAYVLW